MAIFDKMKKAVVDGLKTSKDALVKAKDKTKEVGEKSISGIKSATSKKKTEDKPSESKS
ncbi:MAG: hypothetical protein JSV25_15100 [Spirochaetota bacterium]|nr:MAG: hypothetical protein JSV25_15100 [Spirochaetota bacterium]